MSSNDTHQESVGSEGGAFRRYALPVVFGLVLGLAVLALVRWFVIRPVAEIDAERTIGAGQGYALHDEELRRVIEGSLRGPGGESSAAGSSGVFDAEPWKEPRADAACGDSVECLQARSGSAWELQLDAPADAAVGDRIAADLVSAGSGLVTLFIVEPDGSVLVIYPTPSGDVPVVPAGRELRVPRPQDRIRLQWSRPGRRDLVAVVSTEPFVPPPGEAVAGLLTVYDAASGAAAEYFAALEGRIAADRKAGTAAWSVATAEVEVSEERVSEGRVSEEETSEE